jgi:hypothetical protein
MIERLLCARRADEAGGASRFPATPCYIAVTHFRDLSGGRVPILAIKETETMKMIRVTFLVWMFALLSGCMLVPVNGGPPGYYAPAYVGPTIGIGVYGGGGHGYGRGYGHH